MRKAPSSARASAHSIRRQIDKPHGGWKVDAVMERVLAALSYEPSVAGVFWPAWAIALIRLAHFIKQRLKALEASLLGDVYVVKKLHDFVTSTGYNFLDSIFRRRVQAPVFPQCLGVNILLPKLERQGAEFQADAWKAQRIGVSKTENSGDRREHGISGH